MVGKKGMSEKLQDEFLRKMTAVAKDDEACYLLKTKLEEMVSFHFSKTFKAAKTMKFEDQTPQLPIEPLMSERTRAVDLQTSTLYPQLILGVAVAGTLLYYFRRRSQQ